VRLITEGIAATPSGYLSCLWTFTEPPAATLDVAGFYRRMKNTRRRLKRYGWITESCTSVEMQKRSALHAHMVAWVPADVAARMPLGRQLKRTRAQWRWHFLELVPLVQELGWGKVCDARRLDLAEDPRTLASYVAKDLSSYLTKEAAKAFKERRDVQRIRPIRPTPGWYSGGLTQAYLDAHTSAHTPDPGPWVIFRSHDRLKGITA
jgi:hypothetical protein